MANISALMPPLRLQKSPRKLSKLTIDENTAPIVRSIFEMKASSVSVVQITRRLNTDGITSPREYYYQAINRKNPKPSFGVWSDSVIKSMIRNEAYIGNLVQFKSGTISYKNRKNVGKERDEWVRADNTHEPIISLDLWERVQALLNKKYQSRRRKDGDKNLFSGLLECGDCGYKLRGQFNHKKRADSSDYFRNYYTCGMHARSGKAGCTIHYINEKTLTTLVEENIRKHARLVERNEESVIESILTAAKNNVSTSYRVAYKYELDAHKKQIDKLDLLIENLYNDKVTGEITADMFKRLSSKYEKERVDRQQSVETLEKRIADIKENSDNAETWVKLIKTARTA